jgi:hypothetical protein
MSETKLVQVRAPDGAIKECSIEIIVTPSCKLLLSGVKLESKEFSGEDVFEALVQLRLGLEKMGYQLLCAGARPDVWPSGMGRSMGAGRKAYITRLDAPSRKADLLDIFDYARPELVGSVAQQKSFHETCVESRRKKWEARKKTPLPGEIEEAKRYPNGWVYRIAGSFAPNESVPPEAIIGAWRVDPTGCIIDAFVPNKNYNPDRWSGG